MMTPSRYLYDGTNRFDVTGRICAAAYEIGYLFAGVELV